MNTDVAEPEPPTACRDEARAWITSRQRGWIGHAVSIIQHHNTSIDNDGGFCRACGSRWPLLWETP